MFNLFTGLTYAFSEPVHPKRAHLKACQKASDRISGTGSNVKGTQTLISQPKRIHNVLRTIYTW